jgi:hypothetical protein
MKKTSSQYRGVSGTIIGVNGTFPLHQTTQGVRTASTIWVLRDRGRSRLCLSCGRSLSSKTLSSSNLNRFPDDKLPTPKRQTEIKAEVIARVKARRGGTKGNLDATSRFYGVSYIPRDQLWRTLLKSGSRYYYLGLYTTEIEAAYAYNCAVSIEKVMRKTNPVTEADLVSSERATSIHAEVVSRLDAAKTGKKVSLGKSSRYRGACFIEMDLTQATGVPEPVELAGQDYPVRLLTMREWAALSAWLKKESPSPVTRAAQAIKQARLAGEPFDIATEKALLDHAQQAALNWPPRIGSSEWFEAISVSTGAMCGSCTRCSQRPTSGSPWKKPRRSPRGSTARNGRTSCGCRSTGHTRPKTDAGAGSDVRAGEPEPDEWDTIVFRLNDEHGIDPCPVRRPDLSANRLPLVARSGEP